MLAALGLSFAAGCQTTEQTVKKSDSFSKGDPQKLAEAKETLRQVPTVNDQVAEAFYQQGLAFEEQGLDREAAGEYLKALKLKPSFAQVAYTQLGMLYMQNDQWDPAIDAFSSAVALNPSSALAYGQLGRALAAKGDNAKAVSALNRAVLINPDFEEAHYQAGKVLWKSDRYLAATHFRRVLELSGDVSRKAELRELLNQMPLEGEPIAEHQTVPPQRAAYILKKVQSIPRGG